tara:strand:+ start:760 stop:915 length:156 start_codon:yes stop_codon:yes gene_type:complete
MIEQLQSIGEIVFILVVFLPAVAVIAVIARELIRRGRLLFFGEESGTDIST